MDGRKAGVQHRRRTKYRPRVNVLRHAMMLCSKHHPIGLVLSKSPTSGGPPIVSAAWKNSVARNAPGRTCDAALFLPCSPPLFLPSPGSLELARSTSMHIIRLNSESKSRPVSDVPAMPSPWRIAFMLERFFPWVYADRYSLQHLSDWSRSVSPRPSPFLGGRLAERGGDWFLFELR